MRAADAAATAAPGLAIRGLGVDVGGRPVLHDLDLDVPPGARLGIVGTNGTGKSTLLRTIAGILRPRSGSVRLITDDGEHDLHELPGRTRAQALAFVPQDEPPQADLLVGEAVALGRIPRRPPWARGGREESSAVRRALDLVGLLDRVNDPCEELSGGERRRAVLARGLAQDCPLLLLDEPTNHLDVAWQLRMLDLTMSRPGTVLATMHDLDLAMRVFDTVAVLDEGRLQVIGPPSDVLSRPVIARHFAVDSEQVQHPRLPQRHLLLSRPAFPSTPPDKRSM